MSSPLSSRDSLRSPSEANAIDILQARSIRTRLGGLFSILSQLAFGVMVVLIPFRYRFTLEARPVPPIYGDYTDLLIFGSEIFLAAALIFWFADLGMRPRPFGWGPWWLFAPLAGVLLTSAASIASSIDPLLTTYQVLRNVLMFGLYLYAYNEVKRLTWLAIVVLAQVYVQSTVSLGQIIRQESVGLGRWGELLLDADWSGVSIVWAEGIRSLRAYGLSDHPNILGGSLAFGLVMIAAWYPTISRRWQAPVTAGFGLGVTGLFLTFSRASWLAAAFGLLTSAILYWRKTKLGAAERAQSSRWLSLLIAAGLMTLPILWLNLDFFRVRLNQDNSFSEVFTEEKSLLERDVLNQAANRIFASKPLTGVGYATFPQALLAAEPELRFDYQPAHIALLDAAAETGIFGALFYALSLLAPLIALAASWRNRDASTGLIAATAALVGLFIVGLFDYYTWLLVPGRLWQWLVWGVWAGMFTRND